MSMKSVLALVLGATAMAGAAFDAGKKPTLTSGKPARPGRTVPQNGSAKARTPNGSQEALFRGDMSADLGLGCSNPTGTSGGPNDWATKVTATLTPPFLIAGTTYNVFTFNSGPTWDLVAWQDGATPGAELERIHLGAANGTAGDHTVAVNGHYFFKQQTFFFGLSQGADTVGVRIGMDASGSTPNTVFIRAPGCGLPDFGTVEAIGFPGYWVHRLIVIEWIPVELMSLGVS